MNGDTSGQVPETEQNKEKRALPDQIAVPYHIKWFLGCALPCVAKPKVRYTCVTLSR